MDVKNWLKDFLRERDDGKKFLKRKILKYFLSLKSLQLLFHVQNNHILSQLMIF